MTENADSKWGGGEFQLCCLPPSDRCFPWESADPDERNAQRRRDYERERERIEQRDHQYQHQYEREQQRVVQRRADAVLYRDQPRARVITSSPVAEPQPQSQYMDERISKLWNAWLNRACRRWAEITAEAVGSEIGPDVSKLQLRVGALKLQVETLTALIEGRVNARDFQNYVRKAEPVDAEV